MRTSPLFMAFLYLGMGILFTYLAVQSAEETVWNFMTVLLAFFATMDFVLSIRLFRLRSQIKKAQKKNDQ